MIKIMRCFTCKHYKMGACPAYPEGIPEDILFDETRNDKVCENGVEYQNIVKNK